MAEHRHIGPGAFLLYTLNFTTLVSGPIQRYEDFAQDQFAEQPVPLGARTIGLQLERIVRGLFKVDVLAMLIHAFHQHALAQINEPLPLPVKLYAGLKVAGLYPLFLYANFSGYIDIVIALARLVRLRLPENFDRPFSASSVIEFWAKWHITLSNWLRTYVYNPLLISLMRRFPAPRWQASLGVICFFVTFFLIGVWHGRTSEFVVFGVLTGGGMSINKIWQLRLTKALGRKGYGSLAHKPLYTAFGRGLNFTWFSLTLFWFWGSWSQIENKFHALNMFCWLAIWILTWLLATVLLEAWEQLRGALISSRGPAWPLLTSRYARMVYASALCLITVAITTLLNQSAPDLVYKTF